MNIALNPNLRRISMKPRHGLDQFISKYPDFPKAGITFYDISPALAEPDCLKTIIDSLIVIANEYKPDIIAGIDARGFLFATPLAIALGLGTIMVRKSGKLPGKVSQVSYDLEYGKASLTLQQERDLAGMRVMIVDDLIATGGTAKAAETLITKSGGIVAGIAVLIELTGLKARDQLTAPVSSLQQYEY